MGFNRPHGSHLILHCYVKEQAPSPYPKYCITAASHVLVQVFLQPHGELIRKLILAGTEPNQPNTWFIFNQHEFLLQHAVSAFDNSPKDRAKLVGEMKGKSGPLFSAEAWLNGNSSHELYIFYPQFRCIEKKALLIKIRDASFSNASLLIDKYLQFSLSM